MIKLNNVSKSYGEVQAVRSVTLHISKGEICGLLGRNGAGKTTIMKMITGYLEPTEGSIEVAGIPVDKDRVSVQAKIGYMPENAPLYPEMLVQDYLLMMARLRGVPDDQLRAAVVDAVKAVGLEAYVTRPIATLSKGYRQRVGLAQAIVHKPDVLILDEPTNGLDPVQILEIRKLIKKLAQNATVILSTHILQEIEALCDRVLILIEGELAKDAPLSAFLSDDRIQFALPQSVDASEVKKCIEAVDGISSVAQEGPDKRSGFVRYTAAWTGDAPPIPQLVQTVAQQQWPLAYVTAEPMSLETAFGRLIEQHAEKQKQSKEAAA